MSTKTAMMAATGAPARPSRIASSSPAWAAMKASAFSAPLRAARSRWALSNSASRDCTAANMRPSAAKIFTSRRPESASSTALRSPAIATPAWWLLREAARAASNGR